MFTLNRKSAEQADQKYSRITEKGKYIGTFTRAEVLMSTRGTEGVGFTFVSTTGAECSFDVYTKNKDGDVLPGERIIHAIMAVLRVRATSIKKVPVKKYDRDAGQMATVTVDCLPELMNQPIGLLLYVEEYEKMQNGQKTGDIGSRMQVYAPFQADTELTASEVLGSVTQPALLSKLLVAMKDRPVKGDRPRTAAAAPAPGASFADMDDDIPF